MNNVNESLDVCDEAIDTSFYNDFELEFALLYTEYKSFNDKVKELKVKHAIIHNMPCETRLILTTKEDMILCKLMLHNFDTY